MNEQKVEIWYLMCGKIRSQHELRGATESL